MRKKFFWLLLALGLSVDPTAAKAQDGPSNDLYANYTYFEACHAFLDGDPCRLLAVRFPPESSFGC